MHTAITNRRLAVILGLGLFILVADVHAIFEDDEGCLMCHKYPRMARVTEDGALRSYYVMPGTFSNTVHRNVPCRDCHNYIKELPHRKVETGVTCNTECHSIKNPATGKPFSHKGIYDAYASSVHGRKKIADGAEADKPYCVACHTNPLYNPAEEAPPQHIIDRCVSCHEDTEFAKQWYKHTSRRILQVKRSSIEIVALCSSCHANEKLVERRIKLAEQEDRPLGRKFDIAVESYEESFHGKLTRYGFTRTANCLDCHAESENYFKSVHTILPSRDELSPVHEERRWKTCKRCHTYADENYSLLDPHPGTEEEDNQFRHYAEMIYNWMSIIVISGLVGLSLFETVGRRRDGVGLRLRHGTSWWRRSKRGRDRVV